MVHTFIVSKKFLRFKLHIDGVVQVKDLPFGNLSAETTSLLTKVHQTFIDWHCIKSKNQNHVKVAVEYFEKIGFEVIEKSK